jgi:hypothetical protein
MAFIHVYVQVYLRHHPVNVITKIFLKLNVIKNDKQKNTTPATTSPRNENFNLLVRINFLNLFLHFYLNKN